VDIYEAEWHRNQRSGKTGIPSRPHPRRKPPPDLHPCPMTRRPPQSPSPHRLLLSVSTRPRPRTPLQHPPWRLCPNGRPLRPRYQGPFLHPKQPLRPPPLSFRKAKTPKTIEFYRIL
jgi:hypothetical protein